MDEAFEEPAGGEDACPCEEDEAPADDMQDPADDLGEGGGSATSRTDPPPF